MTQQELIMWVEKNYPKYKCNIEGANISMFCGVSENALLYLGFRKAVIPTTWADDETKRVCKEINHWIKQQL